tara:strand:+ start:953 stop:1804 length:852 start_codon:yes stop_codon:yes gene_type:complete
MKLSVIILNFNRPGFIKKDIIPSLNNNNNIDEIIISHGKKETKFEGGGYKVKHLHHYGEMNKKYGLTLRFLSGLESKNKHMIIMDDDIIPTTGTINTLFEKIQKDERIYGLYGRDIRNGYTVTNCFGEVPIILTRCLVTTKGMCQYFIDNYNNYEYEEIKKAKPFWNGEDILFSLLSIKKYNKLPISIELKHYNRYWNYLNIADSISVGGNHLSYRKMISDKFVDDLDIKQVIRNNTKVNYTKNQFLYFLTNSILIYYIFIIIFFSSIFIFRKKIKSKLKWIT